MHVFLISALPGSGQLHAPAALTPGKVPPGTHWIGGWVVPRPDVDDVEKILDPTGTRTPNPFVVRPIASRYNDCAVSSSTVKVVFAKINHKF
jgi:hypothetical protein